MTDLEFSSEAKNFHKELNKIIEENHFELLLFFDIDHFIRINADHGKDTGDKIINITLQYVKNKGWRGYRVGGDMFVVIFKKDDPVFVNSTLLHDLPLKIKKETNVNLSFSGGCIQNPGEDFGNDPRMGRIIFSTAQKLCAISKHKVRGQIIWLPFEPVGSYEIVQTMVIFYKKLARINYSFAREIEIEARTDFLTGLLNRKGFDYLFTKLVDKSKRENKLLTLLYMDSDSLKKINNDFGHDAGDRFIMDISKALVAILRNIDYISRWGGDEFAVLAQDLTKKEALTLAERIRSTICERTQGTISIGVFCDVPQSCEQTLKITDAALYLAKEKGKNRIEIV